MEEQNESSLFENVLPPGIEKNITDAGNWIKKLSILGFVFGGFVAIALIFNGSAIMQQFASQMPVKVQGLYGALVLIFFIFFFAFAAILYFLYKAANSLVAGVQKRDSFLIAQGFSYLKLFFIITAILGALQLVANISNLVKSF